MPPRRQSHEPKTTVVFVRHGKTPSTGLVLPGRTKGLHLSGEGQAQADAAAERIRSAFRNVAAVYASPLERTRETARPIAAALGLKVQTERRIIECDFGEWTGANLKSLSKLPEWSRVQSQPSAFRFPNGESFAEMQARMVDAIDKVTRTHAGGTVVLVSHADPIKAALCSAVGAHLDMFQRMNISPCSLSVVSYGAVPAVLTVNSTDLQGLQPS